jgi:HEPN domain-containing protein
VSDLLTALGPTAPDDPLIGRAKALDKHYIPTRYPNGFPSGAPMDYYTAEDSTRAIDDAEAIIRFCEDLLARPAGHS